MQGVLAYTSSTLGKKVLMAVTGVILFAYVVVHMLGNLQIYLGPAKLNGWGHFLHSMPGPLWIARIILLFSVGVHILYAVELTLRNWGSRPIKYYVRHYREADYAARTMVWSGPIIALFVVYHILDLTTGTVHPGYVEGGVFHNVVTSFQVPWVAAIYIFANILLAFHLYHGLWSLFQTFGASHPTYDRWRRWFAAAFAIIIGIGNVSIPVSVLTGVVHL
jgi:succinate dehydrogenase / fumarate reductase cytochrome b subunit